jgi:regulator of protease activity HflC (stomatin/prohibitin superfamily)
MASTATPLEPDDEVLSTRDRLWNGMQSVRFYLYASIVVALLIIGFIWPRMFITIPAGYHGVMYRTFGDGTKTDRIWGEGFHVVPPWDELTLYETRLQHEFLTTQILSEEGLDLGVTLSVRYRAERDMLGFLHQDVGPTYFERLVRPAVEAHLRETFGNRPASEIYASAGDLLHEVTRVPTLTRLADEHDDAAETRLRSYVIIQQVKVVDIDLPEIVKQAIADRYRQQQLMLEYEDRLAREEKEAERKRIEAKGIHDFNDLTGELSADVLRWKDIEATKEVAKSPSSKVIMLGNGGSSAPLVFSLGADVPPAAPAPERSDVAPPDSGQPAP